MQQSNQLSISLPQGSTLPLVLGKNKYVDLYISNNSNIDKAYNATVIITVADSLEITSSTINATSYSKQPNYTTVYSYVNVKDFAISEINYKMGFETKSNLTYQNETSVNFNTKLQCTITLNWDSKPRGPYDEGNIQYTNSTSFEFDIKRLSINKNIPSKKVKGAGTDVIEASKKFECIVEVINNVKEDTTFDITDILPDGIRYLGNISVITSPATSLPSVVVNPISQFGTRTIEWKNCVLLKGEVLKFRYQAAIWNKYSLNGVENNGSLILHGTALTTQIKAENLDISITSISAVTAMDAILTLTDNRSVIDVDDIISYNMNVEVNQYYSINNAKVVFYIPDGQQSDNVSGGTILAEQSDHTIPVEFDVPQIDENSSWNVSLTAKVVSLYRIDLQNISCGDTFNCKSSISSYNIYSSPVSDNSFCNQYIVLPTISKNIVNIYYRDKTVKSTTSAIAPLDLVEYELTFECAGIKAVKKNIILDDFFPLDSRLPDIQTIQQISGDQIMPELISPHGLRWYLGDINSTVPWKIRLTSQMGSSVTNSFLNNLFKLSGTNHDNISYSNRKQTSLNLGKPNFVITRSYDNFTPSNVCGGVEYTCRLKISNYQNSNGTTTDAFGFQMVEQPYNGITLVPASWSVSGSAIAALPQGSSNFLTCQILRMYVGQDITFSYKVILPVNIYPGFSGSLASQVGVPYTQIFDSLSENVLYNITSPTSTVQLKTKSLSISKNYSNTLLQVGNSVAYSLSYTIPKCTSIYNANLVDSLPVGQSLIGDVYLNNQLISVTTIGQNIIFPEITSISPTAVDAVYSYTFTALINDASISYPTTTQTNRATLSYKDYLNQSYNKSASKNVMISHPLLSLTFYALNGTKLDSMSQFTANLTAQNIGAAGARECEVEVPIPLNAEYISSSSASGSITISTDGKLLSWNIGSISSSQTHSLTINFKGVSSLSVGDVVQLTAKSLQYKNSVSDTKIYPQVTSNTLTYQCDPDVLLNIYPANKTLAGNGYIQFSSNSVISALYSVVNLGGGKDSFSLSIAPIKWPYDLYIGNVLIANVSANSPYSESPSQLANMPSGNTRDIKLVIYIPQISSDEKDRFTITATSAIGSPYSSSVETILMDP